MSYFYDDFLATLTSIFQLRDEEIAGKVDMQKSFYLAKEIGLAIPFKFRWSNFGPFSWELDNALQTAIRQGDLTYDGSYNLLFDSEGWEIPEYADEFFTGLNKEIRECGYNRVYFIETLASLHFLFKYSGLHTREEVLTRLGELKPKRIMLLERYLEPAWEFLERYQLFDEES